MVRLLRKAWAGHTCNISQAIKNKLLLFPTLGIQQEAKHFIGLFGFGKMCVSNMGILLAPIHKPTQKRFVFVKRSETVAYV